MTNARQSPILWPVALLSLALLAPLAAGQAASAPRGTTADGFVARNPGDWTVVPEPLTGDPAFVYGSRSAPPFRAASDAEFEAAARVVVDQNSDLFGFGSQDLVLVQVKRLDLAAIGSSDKVAVEFRQQIDSLRVWQGGATILFDAKSGDVLALDTTGAPFARDVDPIPRTPEFAALDAARSAYREHTGFEPLQVDATDLVILGRGAFDADHPLVARGPALAWAFDLATPGMMTDHELPAQARVFVSAEGDLAVFAVVETAFAALSGKVSGNVNAGPEPNYPNAMFPIAANQETPALANLFVRRNSAIGPIVATTDANGNYNANINIPTNLYFSLQGPWCRVANWSGPASAFVAQVQPGIAKDILFNPTQAEFPTAEVAAFHWVNRFRDFIKATDAADATMDFQVLANVNKKGTCNAFFVPAGMAGGPSINFFRATPVVNQFGAQIFKCVPTGYRSGVHHEEGHWANTRYNGNGLSGAFHEGVADAWSYYVNDDPCFWLDLKGPGKGCERNGEQNNVKKCKPDGNEKCHGGEVHREGEAIASALWKVKRNLKNQMGKVAGGAVANKLYLSWLQAFNDAKILNVILDHYIALDDDDGDFANGTPHFKAINDAFVEQGWPGFKRFTTYGAGCPGTGGKIPLLAVYGTGSINSVLKVVIEGGKPNAPGLLRTSGNKANAVIGNCTALIGAPGISSLPFVLDGTGMAAGQLTTGSVAVFHKVFMQAFVTDNGAAGGIAYTNGVEVVITK